MKKPTKFLAWVLAASMVATALPVTAMPVMAKDQIENLATAPDADEDDYDGFYLDRSDYETYLLIGEKGTLSVTPKYYGSTQKPISYQWQYYDDVEGKWIDIAGANSSSLDIVGTLGNTDYRVKAADGYNHSDTEYFYIYHKSGIKVTSNRTYYNVEYGKSLTLSVKAEDKNPGASITSYQWYKDSKKIKGATSASYTVTVNEETSYSCEVKDSVGDSKSLYFEVNPTTGLTVNADKTTYNVVSGGSQTLAVNATTEMTGTAIGYQWSMYNKTTKKYDDIAGANASTYTVSGVTASTKLKCTVSSSYGDFEEEAAIVFNVRVTTYGLNVTSSVYGGDERTAYVQTNQPVKFTVTSASGTINASWWDRATDRYMGLTPVGNEYQFTPTTSGYTYFEAYINENRDQSGQINWDSLDTYNKSLIAYDVVGNLTLNTALAVTAPQEDKSGSKYNGYSFTTTNAGEYTFFTDKRESLTIATANGAARSFTTSKENETDALYQATLSLKPNTAYYVIVKSDGDWVYDANYNRVYVPNATAQFTLTVAATDLQCTHANTKLEKFVAATCTVGGYSGDLYCIDCGTLISQGTATPAKGHTPTVVNAKAATFKADGYTGDTVCADCGTVIAQGTKVNKIKSVSLSKSVLTYTGKNLKAKVVVKDSKGKKIAASNYTLKYSKNIKSIGVKTVKVTFKGKYSGTKTLKYTIGPKNTSKLTVKAAKKSINVNWSKQTKYTTGYQIQYSTKKNFKGAKTVTVNKNKTTKTTIKSLKKGTKYYVRIRTYKKVGKSNIGSSWSKVKSVKVK